MHFKLYGFLVSFPLLLYNFFLYLFMNETGNNREKEGSGIRDMDLKSFCQEEHRCSMY